MDRSGEAGGLRGRRSWVGGVDGLEKISRDAFLAAEIADDCEEAFGFVEGPADSRAVLERFEIGGR